MARMWLNVKRDLLDKALRLAVLTSLAVLGQRLDSSAKKVLLSERRIHPNAINERIVGERTGLGF
jgi:hypothetical protein